jgi:CMP-N,N'-diacetyllegionaminic acid synthase
MRILYLIPSRRDSKGLPGKGTKLLINRPLIEYSIDFALENLSEKDELCISTNDPKVRIIVEAKGLNLPFNRPEALSTDYSSMYDVILHALNFYEAKNTFFDAVLLLQPTSPLRNKSDLDKIIQNYDSNIDMVVSVNLSKENPYFTLFEESEDGFLHKCKSGEFTRRQDCPKVYTLNGSYFLINVMSLKRGNIAQFNKIRKIETKFNLDIDTEDDWKYAEYVLCSIIK